MIEVQDAYVRHDRAIELGAKYNGKPLKSVKGIVRKEEEKQMKLAELEEYLEFIYGPNKAESWKTSYSDRKRAIETIYITNWITWS